MDTAMWKAIVADIEGNLDTGEGYGLNIRTKGGDRWEDYAWEPLEVKNRDLHFRAIILSQPDRPPVYLAISEIESVELVS